MVERARRIVFVCALAGACRNGTSTPCPPLPTDEKPVVVPKRSFCGEKTWDPKAPFEPPAPWVHTTCPVVSTDVYERHGARDLTSAELVEFHERHAREFLDVTGQAGVGIGACCLYAKREERRLCIVADALNCGVTREELFLRVDRWLEKDGFGDASLAYLLNIHSVPDAPRCKDSLATCKPRQHEGSKAVYVPAAPRCPAANMADWQKVCENDGECEIAGCGGCLFWNQYSPLEACMDQVLSESRGYPFCGCVAGRCAWFKQ